MIAFKFLRFPFVVCVPHAVNELVTDIILNITSQEDLMLTLIHIGSRLFELLSKKVRVKKQPGRRLRRLVEETGVVETVNGIPAFPLTLKVV